jgi:hypothetical protein
MTFQTISRSQEAETNRMFAGNTVYRCKDDLFRSQVRLAG